jgi:hypothetical protein
MSVSSCIRRWLLVACVLSLGTPSVDTGAEALGSRAHDAKSQSARCDSTATASGEDGCAAHPGESPARNDGVVAEPDLRALKGASPRSAPPVFGALFDGAPRFTAPHVTPFALPGHSRAELRRPAALFVLRC